MAVGRSAHHGAIAPFQCLKAVFRGFQPPVEFNHQVGAALLQRHHALMLQRRNRPVLLGIKALQPGLTGMNSEAAGPRQRHPIHEVRQQRIAVEIVNADPMLHGHGESPCVHHGFHAAGDQIRFRHQAGSEISGLHLLAGATHIEVDLVVAPVLRQSCRFGQQGWVVPPHLQGDRMLHRIEVQQLVASLAVVQRLGHHHFAVEQGPAADLPHQHPEVAVGAIQHRGHTEAVGSGGSGGSHQSIRTARDSRFSTDELECRRSVPSIVAVGGNGRGVWQSLETSACAGRIKSWRSLVGSQCRPVA